MSNNHQNKTGEMPSTHGHLSKPWRFVFSGWDKSFYEEQLPKATHFICEAPTSEVLITSEPPTLHPLPFKPSHSWNSNASLLLEPPLHWTFLYWLANWISPAWINCGVPTLGSRKKSQVECHPQENHPGKWLFFSQVAEEQILKSQNEIEVQTPTRSGLSLPSSKMEAGCRQHRLQDTKSWFHRTASQGGGRASPPTYSWVQELTPG